LSLQGAVIDLWSLCQDDASFNKAAPSDKKDGGELMGLNMKAVCILGPRGPPPF